MANNDAEQTNISPPVTNSQEAEQQQPSSSKNLKEKLQKILKSSADSSCSSSIGKEKSKRVNLKIKYFLNSNRKLDPSLAVKAAKILSTPPKGQRPSDNIEVVTVKRPNRNSNGNNISNLIHKNSSPRSNQIENTATETIANAADDHQPSSDPQNSNKSKSIFKRKYNFFTKPHTRVITSNNNISGDEITEATNSATAASTSLKRLPLDLENKAIKPINVPKHLLREFTTNFNIYNQQVEDNSLITSPVLQTQPRVHLRSVAFDIMVGKKKSNKSNDATKKVKKTKDKESRETNVEQEKDIKAASSLAKGAIANYSLQKGSLENENEQPSSSRKRVIGI